MYGISLSRDATPRVMTETMQHVPGAMLLERLGVVVAAVSHFVLVQAPTNALAATTHSTPTDVGSRLFEEPMSAAAGVVGLLSAWRALRLDRGSFGAFLIGCLSGGLSLCSLLEFALKEPFLGLGIGIGANVAAYTSWALNLRTNPIMPHHQPPSVVSPPHATLRSDIY